MQALRGVTLLLLFFFLLFWLSSEYQKQKERLNKDINNIFSNVMRDIRFGDLEDLAVKLDQNPESFLTDTTQIVDSGTNNTIFLTQKLTDSTISRIPARDSTKPFGNLKISVSKNDDQVEKKSHSSSSISFVKATSQNDSVATSFEIDLSANVASVEEIEQIFKDTLFQSVALFEVFIEKVSTKDSIPNLAGLITKAHSGDFAGEYFYLANIQGYESFVIRRVMPQMLFSIFLFSMTTFSFWLIYKSLKQQQQLTQVKNDFIANMTHELKTPLTTVGVALEAINNFEVLRDPDKTREYLQISRNELGRLNLLVDKVLQLSKFEKQAPKLKMEHIYLDELIEQILQSMKLQFDKVKAIVEFNKLQDHIQLEADRLHITSVIYNLIDNALKYSKDQPQIKINLSQLGETIQLVVKDNGVGIPDAYQEKVFDKFFRIPTGDRHNVKGHGLGLNYVSGIVQQHRGRIELESQEGKGSSFSIFLPTKQ